jgi:hypothetical protein
MPFTSHAIETFIDEAQPAVLTAPIASALAIFVIRFDTSE